MKYMKRFIALLAVSMFIAGCNVIDAPEKTDSSSGNAEGAARVNITINDGAARTILPTLNGGFSKYVLIAEPSEGNTQSPTAPVEINGNSGGGAIFVPNGDWIITATAYVNVGGDDYAAVKGSSWVRVGGNTSVTIAVLAPETDGNGTFTYSARYPTDGSATVKLSTLDGQTDLVNDTTIANGEQETEEVAGGVYFLTVTATSNGKTVIRNEIVYIYPRLSTDAAYVFPKTDFGGGSITLSGTIKLTVDGQQPDSAYLNISGGTSLSSYNSLNFSSNGNAEWSVTFSSLKGASMLSFIVYAYNNDGTSFEKEIYTMPAPIDDMAGIDLGDINIETVLISGTARVTLDGSSIAPGEISCNWYDETGWTSRTLPLGEDGSWSFRMLASDAERTIEVEFYYNYFYFTWKRIKVSKTDVSGITLNFDLKTITINHHFTVNGEEPSRVVINNYGVSLYDANGQYIHYIYVTDLAAKRQWEVPNPVQQLGNMDITVYSESGTSFTQRFDNIVIPANNIVDLPAVNF